MAFNLGAVIAKVDADISGFKKGMAEAKNEASGLGSHLKSIGDGIADFGKKAMVFTGVATAAIVAFGKSSVDAFNESEASLAQMNAVMNSTGKAAGFTTNQLMKHAQALQSVTKYSDEAVMGGQNLLLTFTNIKGPIFTEATETVLDMSTALGQDLKSSSIQLGKALQDPILGITALRRVGVNFSDDQKEVIKKLVETGKTVEAQKLILKELNVEFGGSAKAAAQTFGGQIEILKNKFNDLQETIGGMVAGGLMGIMTGNFEQLEASLHNLGLEGIIPQVEGFINKLRELGSWVSQNKDLVITFLKGVAIGLGALMIIGTIAGLIALITNPLFILIAVVTALYTAWQTNFLGIRDVVMTVVNEIISFWNTYLLPAVQMVTNYIVDHWIYIKDMLNGVWKIIIGIIQVAWSIVYGIIKFGLALLTGDWQKAWDAVIGIFTGAWEGIKSIFNGIVQYIKGWGGWLFDELTSPFRKAWEEIQKLVNKIKDALDFTKRHSPSVVDIVSRGVDKVNDALGGLSISAGVNSDTAGSAVSYGGNQTSSVLVRIDLAGAFITDEYSATGMAEKLGDGIIKKLQQHIRM